MSFALLKAGEVAPCALLALPRPRAPWSPGCAAAGTVLLLLHREQSLGHFLL